MDLNLLWFFLVGVLITGYAILDGFDLGVGILYPLARTGTDRRILLNSIAPVWDGNEVWLVTAGGALFAAFPEAYASAFSGFYMAFILLLFALIFRAVAIEFRNKHNYPAWHFSWDWAFFLASALATLLFGVAVGDMIRGVQLGADGYFRGDFFSLLQPYGLLVGIFTLSVFALHGALYLCLKTDNKLLEQVRRWAWVAFAIFLGLYFIVSAVSILKIPNATRNFEKYKWLGIVVLVNLLAIANIARCLYLHRPLRAFISSAVSIAALAGLMGIALYPNLIVSAINPDFNLTVYNAASSQKTLGIMRNIAFVGMPFVLAYTFTIYWIFRGKVKLDRTSVY